MERRPVEELGLTKAMAQLIVATRYDSIPTEVIEHTKKLALSCFGGMIGGAVLEPSKIVANYVKSQQAAPKASVVGHGFGTSVELAALANGTFAHATQFEDNTFPEGVSTYTLFPPLLALAEAHGLSGKKFLEGVVVGQEVQSRLGRACKHSLQRGYQQLPLMGTLAVAAGAARMLDLNVEKVAWALSLACSQAAGMRIQNGHNAHFLESGTSARAGLLAAYMAANSYEAADYILEGLDGTKLGFCKMVSDPNAPDPKEILDGWGKNYRIFEVTLRRYPCCGMAGAVMEPIEEMQRDHGFTWENVADVEVEANQNIYEGCPYMDPVNRAQAYASITHGVAVVLLEKEVGIEAFSERRLRDPRLVALRKKVRLTVHPDWPVGFRARFAVTTTLHDGRKFRVQFEGDRGVIEAKDLSEEQVLRKFRIATEGLLSTDQMERVASVARGLEQQDNLARMGFPQFLGQFA